MEAPAKDPGPLPVVVHAAMVALRRSGAESYGEGVSGEGSVPGQRRQEKSLQVRRIGCALAAIAGLIFAIFVTSCGGGGATEVKVSLKEWSITPNAVRAEPGKVTLVATNEGSEPHELVVIRSDLTPAALPVIDGKVDEEKVEIVDEIEPFAAATTERMTIELTAGKYILICNIVERVPGEPFESHYENGMRTAFTVED